MKTKLTLIFALVTFLSSAQTPAGYVKISNSPANGKIRLVQITRLLVNEEDRVIMVFTKRRYFSTDLTKVDSVGTELTGSEYPVQEIPLIADDNKLANPSNGLRTYCTGDSVKVCKDILGNSVTTPITMYEFYKSYLDQNVSIHYLEKQVVLTEDRFYKTYN